MMLRSPLTRNKIRLATAFDYVNIQPISTASPYSHTISLPSTPYTLSRLRLDSNHYRPKRLNMSSNAQYIFSGSSSHRPIINLGGIARHSSEGNSQADLIQRAKREREERELGRLKQKASIKIQVSPSTLNDWRRRGED
jgi:hypothetical protein